MRPVTAIPRFRLRLSQPKQHPGWKLQREVDEGRRTLTFTDEEYAAYLEHRYPRNVSFARTKNLAWTSVAFVSGLASLHAPRLFAFDNPALVSAAALLIGTLVLSLLAPQAALRWALAGALAFPLTDLFNAATGHPVPAPVSSETAISYLALLLAALLGSKLGTYLRW